MVILFVKKGDEPQFLYETNVNNSVDDVVKECTAIYNGRLKVTRICYGMLILNILELRIFQKFNNLNKLNERNYYSIKYIQ